MHFVRRLDKTVIKNILSYKGNYMRSDKEE